MHVTLFQRQRVARAAIVSLLLALAIAASAAIANANSPRGGPAESGNGITAEQPIPVEPDGGIGGDVPPDDQPIPVEPDGGIGN
jgi:hypothetical protein